MHSQKAEAKRCFGCRPNARPPYWSDTQNKSAVWCRGPLLVHQNMVFFPCPSFPSRRWQWYFSAFPTERGTQGLKPELHKPISWGLLVVHERLERPKFQVAFLATTHSSFGGRTLFIWLPSAVPSFSGKICPDHQPLVYLFLLQKNNLNKQKFWWQHAHFKVHCPCSGKSRQGRVFVFQHQTAFQKLCKEHSLSHVPVCLLRKPRGHSHLSMHWSGRLKVPKSSGFTNRTKHLSIRFPDQLNPRVVFGSLFAQSSNFVSLRISWNPWWLWKT